MEEEIKNRIENGRIPNRCIAVQPYEVLLPTAPKFRKQRFGEKGKESFM